MKTDDVWYELYVMHKHVVFRKRKRMCWEI